MERNGTILPTFLTAMAMYCAGYAVAYFSNHDSSKADERVAQVQQYNAELHDQLTATGQAIGSLILNDETRTFRFNSQNTQGTPETCTGSYQLRDGKAYANGSLACTVKVGVPVR